MSEAFIGRIFRVDRRYDMPATPTMRMVIAVQSVLEPHGMVTGLVAVLNLIDVIREIIPDATVQDVKVATYLIGEDFETGDIRMICNGIANGRSLAGCEALNEEQRKALKELLETK